MVGYFINFPPHPAPGRGVGVRARRLQKIYSQGVVSARMFKFRLKSAYIQSFLSLVNYQCEKSERAVNLLFFFYVDCSYMIMKVAI